MDPPLILPPNIDDVPPPGLALVLELDKPLLVQLRDGRKLLGTLRSFDQYANLVLEGTKERIVVGSQYAEVDMGLHIVRGENVVLLGDIDPSLDPPPGLSLVPEAEIRRIQKADKEAERMKGTFRTRFDFLMED
ncbi:LSM1 [Auxenochlorella protothecoides x Auxenochlorella symbiontica]|uniref:U6 snRNA-associated Sm-like protein LSm1 n=2 Tax=Auxenochlorella protothecoides TaxID=3075 RepID=A0A087SSF0_AUXPR|nr:U6 snRNA-associated Sm-like protein LSm1 [Auxenochlorella protothecoides]KFM28654.1 U6 snRNA-associated Sm-like protein LSm1 [Auxenochlorella protothecoides]